MFEEIVANCSSCGKTIMVRFNATHHARASAGAIKVLCPLCDQVFLIGFATSDDWMPHPDATQDGRGRRQSDQHNGDYAAFVCGAGTTAKSDAESDLPAESGQPIDLFGGRLGDEGMGSIRNDPSPDDNRSNSLNPNNPASRSVANNRSNQMNPNTPAHRTSRGGPG